MQVGYSPLQMLTMRLLRDVTFVTCLGACLSSGLIIITGVYNTLIRFF